MNRDEIIGEILDLEILIQTFAGEGSPKSVEELNKLPYPELREWLSLRKTVLKMLSNG